MASEKIVEASRWAIAVKTVGGEETTKDSFVVQVSPEDSLTRLQDEIENATGLAPHQQKLIYRGRLIHSHTVSGSSEGMDSRCDAKDQEDDFKIKDIVGLENGHTIHLVRKRDKVGQPDSSDTTVTEGGAGSILGALLGPSRNNTTASSRDDNENDNTGSDGITSPIIRRSGRRTRPRAHYRLTQDDLQSSDPGSMESVRQGLLTLHTLLPPAHAAPLSPLDSPRRWYRGQWIDCRDTVNQWLEATVVDIVYPDEILPSTDRPQNAVTIRTINPATDPAVFSADLEGRRLLLLEPCEEGVGDDEGGELAGLRRRDTNGRVQLLLIHYNGWPHRWDEWIRSDSERIRPFRTRTRHPSLSNLASPTPQSTYSEAPSTFIQQDEASDRSALLPELNRVVTQVHELLQQAAHRTPSQLNAALENTEDLPWESRRSDQENVYETCDPSSDETPSSPGMSEISSGMPVVTPDSGPRASVSRRELEILAPLLDRLGRTLVDAAPHVAALAASVNESSTDEEPTPQLEPINEHPSSLGGLLSLLSRDRRRQSIGSTNVVSGDRSVAASAGEQTHTSTDDSVDPDYTDFATGLVNTTRGEVRAGPRARVNDDVSGLLGAYLAAASLGGILQSEDGEEMRGLGRLLRERGNGNGAGIDIHIHAVVTSPGNAGGPMILPVASPIIGGVSGEVLVPSSPVREPRSVPSFSPNPRSQSSSIEEASGEEMGIFDDLYSETPESIDLSSVDAHIDYHSPGSNGETGQSNTSSSRSTSHPHLRHRPAQPRSESGGESSSHRRGSNRQRRSNPLTRFFRRSES
jgi:hypothetical protein